MASSPLRPVPSKRQIANALVTVDGSLLERRPIQLDGWTLRARSAVPKGKPTKAQCAAAFEFASAVDEASAYWVGDIGLYIEGREDWKETRSQVMNATGLAKQTIDNRVHVSRHVAEPERAISPSLGHSAEVASLPRVEQTKFLEAARDHGWTTRELRHHIRAAKRSRILEGRADGHYTVEVSVLVDVTAQNDVRAEETAWDQVKRAVQDIQGAKVIAAHARVEGKSKTA